MCSSPKFKSSRFSWSEISPSSFCFAWNFRPFLEQLGCRNQSLVTKVSSCWVPIKIQGPRLAESPRWTLAWRTSMNRLSSHGAMVQNTGGVGVSPDLEALKWCHHARVLDGFWVLRLETGLVLLISCAMSLSSWDLLESLGSLSSWKFLFSRVDSTNSWHRFLIVSCPRCGARTFSCWWCTWRWCMPQRFSWVFTNPEPLSRYVSTRRCQSRRSCISSSGTSLGQSHGAQLPCLEIPNKCHTDIEAFKQCFRKGWQLHFARGHDTYQWVGLDVHAGVKFCFHFKS